VDTFPLDDRAVFIASISSAGSIPLIRIRRSTAVSQQPHDTLNTTDPKVAQELFETWLLDAVGRITGGSTTT
jgi:hypothetical protein